MRKRTKVTTRELPKVQIPVVDESEKKEPEPQKDSAIERNIQDIKLLEKEPENNTSLIPIIKPEDEDIGKTMGWQKFSTVLDSDMQICKDYYKTGYCTFGWACKFVHTRDRLAVAYDLDRQFEKKLLDANRLETEKSTIEHIDTCGICKGIFKNPVQLKCGHIFCQKCAFERYKTDHTCAVCGANTEGIFNTYKSQKE